MSKNCAIYGCPTNTKLSKNNLIRLFAFPKNPKIREKWINVCCNPLLNPNYSKICSLHFREEDFKLKDRLLNIPVLKRKLIDTAVPTNIITNTTDYLNENDDNRTCDDLDLHSNEITVQDFEFKAQPENTEIISSTIEFIDISRCSSFEDIGNDSNQNIKFYKDSAVQCNLFEELWQQKALIDSSNNCNCMDQFLETLKFSNQSYVKTGNEEQVFDSSAKELIDGFQNDCNANMKTKKRIRPNNKFPNDIGYQCEKCDKICLNLAAYYAHSDSHLEKSSICSKCGLNLTNHKMVANHERYCLNKTKPIETENVISRNKSSINKTCGICNRTFEKSVTYMDHMNIHNNNYKPYVCSCFSKFSHYANFLTHVRKFNCPVKGRIIPNYAPQGQATKTIEMKEKGLLKQPKRYKCRICGMCYGRDRYLQHFHESIHLNAEKLWLEKYQINQLFSCSHCDDQIFNNLSDCISHRSKIHRRFPNDEYLKSFELLTINNKCENINENKEEHSINIESSNLINTKKRINQLSPKQKYCEKCNKYFVKRITYLDHMNIHMKTYPYICPCGIRKRFYQCFLAHTQKCKSKGKRIFPDYAPQTFANREFKNIQTNNNLNQKDK